jgi:hypothetical protein
MIGHINNSELGLSVRTKLNQVIDFVDAYNTNPPTLADILGYNNYTNGRDIRLNDASKIVVENYADNEVMNILEDGIYVYNSTIDPTPLFEVDRINDIVKYKGVELNSSTTPSLAQVLAVNNRTDEMSLVSMNAKSYLLIYDSSAQMQYFNGANFGYLTIDDNRARLRHSATVKLEAPQIEVVSDSFVISSDSMSIENCSIEFTSGYGIDTTVTAGTDILNIGATNANVINYGNASTIHNFLGTAIYELQVNSYVTDKLITLNAGGSIGSGIGVGFEIEAGGSVNAYIKSNAAQNGYSFKSTDTSYFADIIFTGFTANRSYYLPDANGTLALISQTITSGVTNKAPSEDAVKQYVDAASPAAAKLFNYYNFS